MMQPNHLMKDPKFVMESHQMLDVPQLMQDVDLVHKVQTRGTMLDTWHNARVWWISLMACINGKKPRYKGNKCDNKE